MATKKDRNQHFLYEEKETSNFWGWIVLGVFLLFIMWVFHYAFGSGTLPPPPDERCQIFYGKEYHYVAGKPSLCVTIDGKTRYYDFIK